MANVLSLALKINADASGLKLDPVEKALKRLGDETDKVTGIFDRFAASSEAAAKAQEASQKAFDALTQARLEGTVTAPEFAKQFEELAAAARAQAAAFEEGQRVTEANRTEEEKRAIAIEKLNRLLDLGAIEQETYNRAIAEASGANAEAARVAAEAARQQADAAKVQADALRQRQALESRAAQIINANLTAEERYKQSLRELRSLQHQGLLTQEQFNRAVASARKPLEDSAAAAQKAANANKASTLQFNELSGIFAAMPGPLGNISGRISGLASAGEGLGRVFSGGLSKGFSSVAASATALVNPFTVAAGSVAAFGAAAAAVLQGLVALEDRVEKLGNTADKLGVSFQFIQVLDEAARRSGTSIESVSAAFGRLQKSVLGVDEESKAAQKALAEIGVTAEELQRLNPQEQYLLIGRRLGAIEDPARRTATAVALFGKAGADLLPFFNNIGGAANDLERFGKVLSDIQRRDIDQFGSSMDRLGVATRSASEQLLSRFAPAASRTADAASAVAGAVARNSDTIASSVASTIDGMSGGTLTVVNLATRAIAAFGGASQEASKSANSAAKVAESVSLSAEEVERLGKAIADGNKSLDSVIAKAGEFGQAGFNAALEFQNALADLQEQADAKELDAEQYARGVANATAEFEKQIDVARRVAEENKRLAEEARRRAEAEAEAVQKIIDSALEQQRVDEQFGGDSNRAKAAENLTKLFAEQSRVEEQLAAAREAGDQKAIDALTSRLAVIDQVAARERDIASGAAKDREDAAKAAQKAVEEAQKRAEQQAQAAERLASQVAEKQAQLQEQQFQIDLERANELADIRIGSVKVNDLRSGGISQLFETLQEDPALAEAKKQRAELEKIRKEIAKLNAEKVDILAGTG